MCIADFFLRDGETVRDNGCSPVLCCRCGGFGRAEINSRFLRRSGFGGDAARNSLLIHACDQQEPRSCRACSEVSNHTTTIRSEEHTSELQSLMRTSYAVFCLQKKTK